MRINGFDLVIPERFSMLLLDSPISPSNLRFYPPTGLPPPGHYTKIEKAETYSPPFIPNL